MSTGDVIRGHVQAFNAGDLGVLLDTLADDAVWTTGRTTVRGKDDLADFFRAALEQLRPTLAVRTLVAGPDTAAAELTETIGASLHPIAGFYRIAGGQITRARIYRESSADAD
jgi:uncharacterized protein